MSGLLSLLISRISIALGLSPTWMICGAVNRPVPRLNTRATRSSSGCATTMSNRPSAFVSAMPMAPGAWIAGMTNGARNVPSPRPCRTIKRFPAESLRTRSSFPSPETSPAATPLGLNPSGKTKVTPNVSLPASRPTSVWSSALMATASVFPSPLRSPSINSVGRIGRSISVRANTVGLVCLNSDKDFPT